MTWETDISGWLRAFAVLFIVATAKFLYHYIVHLKAKAKNKALAEFEKKLQQASTVDELIDLLETTHEEELKSLVIKKLDRITR